MYKFPLNDTEIILRKDLASMSLDGQAYNGALYLTNERIVFVGYVMDIRNKYLEEIMFDQIKEIKLAKSLFIIPNALDVATTFGRRMRFVVKNRDAWAAEIKTKIGEFVQN